MGDKLCEVEKMVTISESVHMAMCQQDEINKILADIECKLSLIPNCFGEEPINPMGLEGKTMLLVQMNTQIINMLSNINNRI